MTSGSEVLHDDTRTQAQESQHAKVQHHKRLFDPSQEKGMLR